MKNLLLFCICLGSYFISSAQTENVAKNQIGVSYFAHTFTHPGLAFSFVHLLKKFEKTRTTRKGKTKTRRLDLLAQQQLGFYNFKENHFAYMFNTGVNVRYFRKKGKYWSLGVLTGVQQRFLNDDAYAVSETGEVTRATNNNSWLFNIGLQTQFGQYFQNNPLGWFLSSNLMWSAPYANEFIGSSILELGMSYRFKK
ncbi:MAG: hypothetical protein AB8G22_04355 [Saprospiraceae bacterium]